MKVLLIEPPFARFMGFYRFFFPFSLASLSAYIKPQGHEVLIYDADHADRPVEMNSTGMLEVYPKYLEGIQNRAHPIWEEVGDVISDFHPDLIGISYLSTKTGAVENIIRIARSLQPNTPIVLGGSHPSVLCESSLKQTGADFVVLGEGEATFAELVDAISEGAASFENIRGLGFLSPEGRLVTTPPRPLIPSLDSLPFPDRESLRRLESYRPDDMGMIMTSRGCPFNCTFCTSIWQRRTRYRSIPHIVAEIEYLMKRFQVENIYFKDDTFTTERKRILEFCDTLEAKGIRINWECLTRIELMDEELIRRMQEAGMFNLKIGIETGSQRLLTATNKNITLEQVKKGAAVLNRLGQKWTAFFMFGYPDETEAEIQMSRDLIEEIAPSYVSMSILVPYPGCQTYYDLEQTGAIHAEVDWNLYDPFSLYANASLVFDLPRFQEIARDTMKFIDAYNLQSSRKSPKISQSTEKEESHGKGQQQ